MATTDCNRPTSLVWHYTTGHKFILIVEDGYLRQATAGVGPLEKPILWFSVNQVWEPTANKMIQYPDGSIEFGTRETTRTRGGGLVRFGYRRDRLHPWPKSAKKARIDARVVADLEASARSAGSDPGDWYGTTQPIPLSRIVRIDVEENGSWVPVRRLEP